MSYAEPGLDPVRIPADVDREDRLLADLTARQVAILAATAAVLWLAFMATRHLVAPAVFAGAVAPVALASVVVALGRRDGLSLDRLLVAALRQARSPHQLVTAPEGVHPPPRWLDPAAAAQASPLPTPLRLPASGISAGGAIDLGGDGTVAVAAASTINFALRTLAEQQAVVGAFGRWLNSLQWSPAWRTTPLACRIPRWRALPSTTPRSWPAWPCSGICLPGRCCSSCMSPSPRPPGGVGRGAMPTRRTGCGGGSKTPPGCWPQPTSP